MAGMACNAGNDNSRRGDVCRVRRIVVSGPKKRGTIITIDFQDRIGSDDYEPMLCQMTMKKGITNFADAKLRPDESANLFLPQ